MSLLITRDYANKGTPLWLATSGGTIDGDLRVDGSLTVLNNQSVYASGYWVTDPSGSPTGRMLWMSSNVSPFTSNGVLFQGDQMRFSKVGSGATNTTLTISAAGANADNFTLGGTLNCSIGPVPTQLITSTKTVNPVAVSPTAPSQFGVDVSLTGISNAEYDVQATGTVYVVSGTVDASDTVVYSFTSGAGQGSMTSTVVPSSLVLGGFGVGGTGPLTAGGAAANVFMRGRVTPNASGTVLGANVRVFSPNASTAVYGATLSVLDVQRVR
jgi:hypothetical protein